MDAEGFNKIGDVFDSVGTLNTKPAHLCDECHMVTPVSIEFEKVS